MTYDTLKELVEQQIADAHAPKPSSYDWRPIQQHAIGQEQQELQYPWLGHYGWSHGERENLQISWIRAATAIAATADNNGVQGYSGREAKGLLEAPWTASATEAVPGSIAGSGRCSTLMLRNQLH